MAKTHRIKNVDNGVTFTIDKPGDTWIFQKSATIRPDEYQSGIIVETARKTKLILENRIIGGDYGIEAYGGNNLRIEIADGARIKTGTALYFTSMNAVVVNRGTLESDDGRSVVAAGGANLEFRNYGSITTTNADQGAVVVWDTGSHIYNEKSGRIEGVVGVDFQLPTGQTGTIVNRGVISGEIFSIRGFHGDDTVINRGKLDGRVGLDQGNDTLDTRGGRLTDKGVLAGSGDDTLITDNADYYLIELEGFGNDTIKSTVSYKLADNSNVENLVLIGKKNINATGSAQDETVRGNSGNNRINGGDGNDQIYGGKGNDRLTGGGQGTFDDFYFKTGDGRDVITDFEGFPDRIFIGRWHGMSNFEEVLDNARFKGGDMVIKAGKDSITLLGIGRDDISAQDFDFSM
ncbi:calcium-binding protein [Rhizobium sp.]